MGVLVALPLPAAVGVLVAVGETLCGGVRESTDPLDMSPGGSSEILLCVLITATPMAAAAVSADVFFFFVKFSQKFSL